MNSKIASRLSCFLTVVVVMISICDVALTVSCPWWLRSLYELDKKGSGILFVDNNISSEPAFYLILAFFIICGILGFIILAAAYRILGRIRKSNPFCVENAVSLRNAAVASFILFGLFIGKMFLMPTILTAICGLIFLLFGLFILVISELVRTAAKIKEENDLTI